MRSDIESFDGIGKLKTENRVPAVWRVMRHFQVFFGKSCEGLEFHFFSRLDLGSPVVFLTHPDYGKISLFTIAIIIQENVFI